MDGFIFNFVGTIGVGLILTTYFLLQTGRLKPEDLRYSLMNFGGSGMILISLFHDFNMPSFVVEAAWVLISIIGILRWYLKKQKSVASS